MSYTTLSNVKAFKGITGTSHDSEITRLISVVDTFINNYCNRASLEAATYTEYHSGNSARSIIRLKNYPLASVTSLHDDPNRVYGSDTLIAATDYIVDLTSGIISLDGFTFNTGLRNIKVVYVTSLSASQAALLDQAAIELVWLAHMKGDQALLGLRSRRIADGQVETYKTDWPGTVENVLNSFVKVDH